MFFQTFKLVLPPESNTDWYVFFPKVWDEHVSDCQNVLPKIFQSFVKEIVNDINTISSITRYKLPYVICNEDNMAASMDASTIWINSFSIERDYEAKKNLCQTHILKGYKNMPYTLETLKICLQDISMNND